MAGVGPGLEVGGGVHWWMPSSRLAAAAESAHCRAEPALAPWTLSARNVAFRPSHRCRLHRDQSPPGSAAVLGSQAGPAAPAPALARRFGFLNKSDIPVPPGILGPGCHPGSAQLEMTRLLRLPPAPLCFLRVARPVFPDCSQSPAGVQGARSQRGRRGCWPSWECRGHWTWVKGMASQKHQGCQGGSEGREPREFLEGWACRWESW